MSIRLENVSYVYFEGTPMEKQALANINLSIRDGEFIGLIGHTGSGKSTLIQHFNGLLKPTRGKVFVDEVDLTAKSVKLQTIRKKVGMVFQYPEHQLFGETVFEDVAFGPKNLGIPEEQLEEQVREALLMVDLKYEDIKDRSPFELSGGQKRRVAIAGVLAMKPSILVLDEPTAGLDPRGRDEILTHVKRLHNEWNMTVILVTHSMEDIARVATRLIVMESGKIVLEGIPQEVFKQSEQLQNIGLGVPQMTKLLQTLKSQGFNLCTDVLTLTEVKKEIIKLMETKNYGDV